MARCHFNFGAQALLVLCCRALGLQKLPSLASATCQSRTSGRVIEGLRRRCQAPAARPEEAPAALQGTCSAPCARAALFKALRI